MFESKMAEFVSSDKKPTPPQSPISEKTTEHRYVVLCETNEEEKESWYYFIRYDGNEDALDYLNRQINKVDMYLLEDLSTFDLDLDHFFSEQTAKEMIRLEVNSFSFHRMFTGKLDMIDMDLRKKDDNEDRLIKFFEKIGKGQIDDYITGEFVHPEDMLSEVEETGSGDSSGDELLVPREAIPSSLQKAVKAVKKGGKRRA